MKTLFKFFIVLVVLAVIGFAVKIFYFDKKAQGEEVVLVTTEVFKTNISTVISTTGSLEAVDQVEVGTQVSGDISKIFVNYNSKVKKGQVIAELDKSKLQATLTQCEINYKSAENDYKYKKSTYERTKKLAENNSASTVDLEEAEYNMNAAKFTMDQRKNEVDEAKLNLSYAIIKSPIDGVVIERSVDVGQTVAASMSTPTLFIIAKDLTQMQVLADVDEADIGQVKAGQRVEFTVDAFQDDTFSGKVQEVRLNATVTSNVVTYTVVITADNPDLKLLPSMTATCTIYTQEIDDAVAVPVKALKFTPDANTPMLNPEDMPPPSEMKGMSPPAGMENMKPPAGMENMKPPQGMQGQGPMGPPPGMDDEKANAKTKTAKTAKKPSHVWLSVGGKAVPRPVKTGISDGVNTQILEGLAVGDTIITGQEKASKVAPVEQEEARNPFMPGPPGKKK